MIGIIAWIIFIFCAAWGWAWIPWVIGIYIAMWIGFFIYDEYTEQGVSKTIKIIKTQRKLKKEGWPEDKIDDYIYEHFNKPK